MARKLFCIALALVMTAGCTSMHQVLLDESSVEGEDLVNKNIRIEKLSGETENLRVSNLLYPLVKGRKAGSKGKIKSFDLREAKTLKVEKPSTPKTVAAITAGVLGLVLIIEMGKSNKPYIQGAEE